MIFTIFDYGIYTIYANTTEYYDHLVRPYYSFGTTPSEMYILQNLVDHHVLGVFSSFSRIEEAIQRDLLEWEFPGKKYSYDIFEVGMDEQLDDPIIELKVHFVSREPEVTSEGVSSRNTFLYRNNTFDRNKGISPVWHNSIQECLPNEGKLTKGCKS